MACHDTGDYLTRARNVLNPWEEGPDQGTAYALIQIGEQQAVTNRELARLDTNQDRIATALERIATTLEHANQQAQQAEPPATEPAQSDNQHLRLIALGVPIGAFVITLLAGLIQWLL